MAQSPEVTKSLSGPVALSWQRGPNALTGAFQDQDGGLAGWIPAPRWYLLSGGSPVLGNGIPGHRSLQPSYGSGDSLIPAGTEPGLSIRCAWTSGFSHFWLFFTKNSTSEQEKLTIHGVS